MYFGKGMQHSGAVFDLCFLKRLGNKTAGFPGSGRRQCLVGYFQLGEVSIDNVGSFLRVGNLRQAKGAPVAGGN